MEESAVAEALAILLRNESRKKLYRDISLTQALFGPIFFIMFAVVLQVRLSVALYFVFWMTLTGLVGFCITQFLMPKIFHYPNVLPCIYMAMLFCGLVLGIATVVQGTLLLATPYLRGKGFVVSVVENPETQIGLGPAIGIGALLTCLQIVAIIMVLRDILGCSKYRWSYRQHVAGRNARERPPVQNLVTPWLNYRIVTDNALRNIPVANDAGCSSRFPKWDNPPEYEQIPPPTYDEAIQPAETEAATITTDPR